MPISKPVHLIALVVGSASLLAGQGTSPEDSLSRLVRVRLPAVGVPGVVWSLVYPDSTVTGAAGVRDLASGAPMMAETRVQLGSVTKTVLATGVLQLITRGAVDLDAPIARYLADLPIDNPWEASSPILVRHLLDHTSGLGDAHLWQVFSSRVRRDRPLRDGIARPGARLRVQAEPGRRFSYSNTGYLLLGILIERVTGERYESWLDRELLGPLGMQHSTFSWATQRGDGADTTMAMGHFEGGTPQPTYAIAVRPAAQFTTTAHDMGTFARFLLSNGRIGERTLVDSVLLSQMGRATTTDAAHAGLVSGYGLGLQTRERWGALAKCHTGNLGTFRAILCLYPSRGRAFFASYNSDPEGAAWDMVDSLFAARLAPDPVETPATTRAELAGGLNGWYLQHPTRFEQFAYLDALTALTRVDQRGDTLTLTPLGGETRRMVPATAGQWRLEDRRVATVAWIASAEGPQIADVQRTLDRVPTWTVWRRWAAAIIGLLAMLGVLIRGVVLVRRNGRTGWRDPMVWPAAALVATMAVGLALTRQTFLAIGDRTIVSVALALATALLLLTTVAALLRSVQPLHSGRRRVSMGERLLLAGLLQWLMTLAWWGLIPLRLWT